MDSLIIKRAERSVRQRIFGGVLMFVAMLMLANSLGLVQAGNNTNSNVTFNIDSGSLSLFNGPTRFRFGNVTYGASGQASVNTEDEIDNLAVQDYRGTSAAWLVAVNSLGNLYNSAGNQINSNRLRLYQDVRGTLTNVDNCVTSKITVGANGTLDGAGVTLINTSSSAGTVRFDNGFVNLTYWATDTAGQYFTTIAFTLS